jgi:hypothetical protein
LGEVRERVAQDVRRQWAWDQAKAAAQRIYDAARSAGEGLAAAAGERPVTTAGPFPRMEFAPVAGADFDEPASRAAFVDESYKMLAEMSADNPKHHPLRVIELPASNKVLVAELASVETAADPARVEMERVRLPLQVRQEWAMRMAPRWLGYDGVIARMGYTDAQPARTASASP